MYRVYKLVEAGWVLMGESKSFSDAWEYGRILKKESGVKGVKVLGPEGSWEIK